MARYDYYTAVTNDVIDDIRESISGGYLDTSEYADHEALAEHLNDELWTADNVTGNGSGTYTFNSARAAEYVTDNTDLVLSQAVEDALDALEESGEITYADADESALA